MEGFISRVNSARKGREIGYQNGKHHARSSDNIKSAIVP